MSHQWDEFSKSLAEPLPRRESLRRLGAVFAGALLSPLGLEAARPRASVDPCKTFCKCSNKTQQNACLAACQACNGDTKRLCGKCGTYTCCSKACCNGACSDLSRDPNCGACGNNCGAFGKTCCGNYCADLANDPDNCGACRYACDEPGPYEVGGCFGGTCVYGCAEGAADCGDGTCTPLWDDPDNCGACGNVCPASAPYCTEGVCNDCGVGYCWGQCIDILFDALNCGACGYQCQPLEHCSWGVCEGSCIGCE